MGKMGSVITCIRSYAFLSDQLVRTKTFLLRIFVQAFSCALVSLATAVAHASLCFRDASTSLGHSSRHILLRLGYQMGNCARNSYDLALGVQLITYEVDPASCASRRRRTAAYPNQMPAHSPDARWRSLPRSLAFYLRRSFYLAAYVRCWISSHRARDPQRDRAAFRPRQSRTASEPQGNGIEFASENPGIAAGGRTTCLKTKELAAHAKSSLRRPGNPFSLHRRFPTHGAPETAFPRHAPRG